MGRAGIEPTTLGLQDDPLTPLSYSLPDIECLTGLLCDEMRVLRVTMCEERLCHQRVNLSK